MKTTIFSPCVGVCAAWFAVFAHAGIEVITPPPLGANSGQIQIAAESPFGQTFEATADTIESIGLRLLNINLSFDLSLDRFVTVDLYEGTGFGGPLLGSSRVDVDAILGRTLYAESFVNFGFGGVHVSPGKTYSFQIQAATSRFGVYWLTGNAYAGGQAILQGGLYQDPDIYFNVTAVPELPSVALATIGIPALAHMIRRRRRDDAFAAGF